MDLYDLAETASEPRTIQERFVAFHASHPEIYAALVRLARTWQQAGKRRCGIKMLWERLRWEMGLAIKSDEGFALDNVMHSRYVRMLCEREPDLAAMFELRALKAQ